ncbi:MAG TPA: CaiB/BaiF CoA-transferase family protein [Candidimonas sp.]|nr:CaiB/BaiF CoA-transferase family protein [Candidimonas sp.]
MQPLKGIKVVDLSKVVAGPLCAQYLGELGAEVVKVEAVASGDDTRNWLPQDQGQSAVFMALNHNKRSIAVDLKTAAGRQIVQELVRGADVVLQGFGGGTAKKLGVDYETLSIGNPKLVYCEISGYGRDGPLGNAPGYDVMLQAFSGMLSTIGDADGNYARASFSPVDLGTGIFAFAGILAALFEREKTGKGAYVELALLDTALGFMTYMAQSYWLSGDDPKPMGTGHPTMCPYQAFQASDGPIMVGAGNDAQWRRFCSVAGLEEFVAHPDFATNAIRVKNMSKTVKLVQERISTKTVAEWVQCLDKANVPCSPVHKLSEALAHPQVDARQLIYETTHPAVGTLRQIGLPVKFQHQPRSANSPPPLLGQHSEQILNELGYKETEIHKLREAGVIA